MRGMKGRRHQARIVGQLLKPASHAATGQAIARAALPRPPLKAWLSNNQLSTG